SRRSTRIRSTSCAPNHASASSPSAASFTRAPRRARNLAMGRRTASSSSTISTRRPARDAARGAGEGEGEGEGGGASTAAAAAAASAGGGGSGGAEGGGAAAARG